MTGIYHQSFLLFIQYYFASTETAFKIVINPAIIPATAHIIPLNIPIDLTVIGDKFNTITKAQVIGAIITIVIIPITKADAYLFFGKKPTILLADRKSTRLNSSHVSISYAVFCLKKKKVEIIYNITLG